MHVQDYEKETAATQFVKAVTANGDNIQNNMKPCIKNGSNDDESMGVAHCSSGACCIKAPRFGKHLLKVGKGEVLLGKHWKAFSAELWMIWIVMTELSNSGCN